jgi:hypothetical protein
VSKLTQNQWLASSPESLDELPGWTARKLNPHVGSK